MRRHQTLHAAALFARMRRWLCIAAVSGAAARRLANESGPLVFRHVAPASGASVSLSTPANSTATAHDVLCQTGITPTVQVLLCFALRIRLQAALLPQPHAAGAGAAAVDAGTAAGAAPQPLARAVPPAADLEPQVPICRFTRVLAERMDLTVNMDFNINGTASKTVLVGVNADPGITEGAGRG